LISQLTSPLDQITSNCRRSRRTNSNHSHYGTVARTSGHIDDGKVSHFQVTLKVGFTMEGAV
jgi:flavin-binding protein dodecin